MFYTWNSCELSKNSNKMSTSPVGLVNGACAREKFLILTFFSTFSKLIQLLHRPIRSKATTMQYQRRDSSLERSRSSRSHNSSDRRSTSVNSSSRCCTASSRPRISHRNNRMSCSSWRTASSWCNSTSNSWGVSKRNSFELAEFLWGRVSLSRVSSFLKCRATSSSSSSNIRAIERLRVEPLHRPDLSTMETSHRQPDTRNKPQACRSSPLADFSRSRSHQPPTTRIWVSFDRVSSSPTFR